jgi:hypothetical protein
MQSYGRQSGGDGVLSKPVANSFRMDRATVGPAEEDGALVLELLTLDVPQSDIAAECVERHGIQSDRPPAAIGFGIGIFGPSADHHAGCAVRDPTVFEVHAIAAQACQFTAA